MSSVAENNRARSKRFYEKHKIVGIYKIINKTNGKYYVGSSKNISGRKGRFYSHKHNLKSNKHYNHYLQRSWNKYGEDGFEFLIVEEVPEENLLMTEQKYLDLAKTEPDKCYNTRFIAGGGDMGKEIYALRSKKYSWYNKGVDNPQYGKPLLEETKKKMSLAKKGLYDGDKHPLYGKKRSKETLEKMRNSMLGKLAGDKNPNYDKTIYSFCHKITGEKFVGSKCQFCKKLGVKSVWDMLSGKTKSVKGWILSIPQM